MDLPLNHALEVITLLEPSFLAQKYKRWSMLKFLIYSYTLKSLPPCFLFLFDSKRQTFYSDKTILQVLH